MVQGDIAIGMAMHAHSIRVMHGGGNGDGNGNTVGGDSGTAATAEGSSWDCIFDEHGNEMEPMEEPNDGGGGSGSAVGMVREEIVKEFSHFWNEDMNRKKPIAARNFICRAVRPTLYGLSIIKLGLLLVLIGGSSNKDRRERSAAEEGSRLNRGRKEDDGVTGVMEEEDEGVDDAPVPFSLGGENHLRICFGHSRSHSQRGNKFGLAGSSA